MAAVPKRKISTRRKGKRRLNHSIKLKNLQLCPSCNQPKLPHQVCTDCGTYKT